MSNAAEIRNGRPQNDPRVTVTAWHPGEVPIVAADDPVDIWRVQV